MKINIVFLKQVNKSVKYQYFFVFSSDLRSVNQYDSFEQSHIELWWFLFLDFTRAGFKKKSKFKIKIKQKIWQFKFSLFVLKHDFSWLYVFGKLGPYISIFPKKTKIDHLYWAVRKTFSCYHRAQKSTYICKRTNSYKR